MIDFTTIKTLFIGGVELKQLFIDGVQIWKGGITNMIKRAQEVASTALYNGCGYKDGYRLNSSAEEKELPGSTITGYIPFTPGNVIRLKGATWGVNSNTNNYFTYFNINKAYRWHINGGGYGDSKIKVTTQGDVTIFDTSDGLTSITGPGFFRIAATGKGEDLIITINEEIE